jgi:hypothetical protein
MRGCRSKPIDPPKKGVFLNRLTGANASRKLGKQILVEMKKEVATVPSKNYWPPHESTALIRTAQKLIALLPQGIVLIAEML